MKTYAVLLDGEKKEVLYTRKNEATGHIFFVIPDFGAYYFMPTSVKFNNSALVEYPAGFYKLTMDDPDKPFSFARTSDIKELIFDSRVPYYYSLVLDGEKVRGSVLAPPDASEAYIRSLILEEFADDVRFERMYQTST